MDDISIVECKGLHPLGPKKKKKKSLSPRRLTDVSFMITSNRNSKVVYVRMLIVKFKFFFLNNKFLRLTF